MIVTTKLYKESILGLKQFEKVLDTEVFVEEDLKSDSREDISIDTKTELNTRACRSWIYLIRLAIMVLVLCFEAC